MNNTQALTRLRKVLGKNAAAQDSKRPSSDDIRQATRTARLAANERRKAAEAAMTARCDALLAADAEYQRLRREYRAAVDAAKALPIMGAYRYRAGVVVGSPIGAYFRVEAEADTLAELVEKVESKKAGT